jgi:hypothetical protein
MWPCHSTLCSSSLATRSFALSLLWTWAEYLIKLFLMCMLYVFFPQLVPSGRTSTCSSLLLMSRPALQSNTYFACISHMVQDVHHFCSLATRSIKCWMASLSPLKGDLEFFKTQQPNLDFVIPACRYR